jgi:peptidoglycan/LPS O-acetylase OafA/YrhL
MRFTNLQALRILGAGIVVLCHLSYHAEKTFDLQVPALKWVFDYLSCVAITVFFSMSGFVLVHSLETTTASQFIRARLLRIFPAYWTAVLLVVLIERYPGLIWFTDSRVIAGLLLVPVGPERGAYRLGIEWTLVFELCFYALLGLMILVHRRRGPTVGALLWLGVIIGAMALRAPGSFQFLPDWSEIAFSPLNAPIVLGALAVHLKPHGRIVRIVAPVAVPSLYLAARFVPRWDVAMLVAGVASALLVAWAAAARQMAADHPLAVYGNWSYGVYLLHVPVITAVFEAAIRYGWTVDRVDLVAGAGCAAMAIGLGYGWCESEVYKRLRRWLVRRPLIAEPTILKLPTPTAASRAA